jgi:hypothetical protein
MYFFMLGQGEYMKYQPHTSGIIDLLSFLDGFRVGSSIAKGKHLKRK